MTEVVELTQRIRKSFEGYGRAIRRREDPPLPDEPYMSMDDAARLSAEFMVAEIGRLRQDVVRREVLLTETKHDLGVILGQLRIVYNSLAGEKS